MCSKIIIFSVRRLKPILLRVKILYRKYQLYLIIKILIPFTKP